DYYCQVWYSTSGHPVF
nr:immunoglobulin light chain junction region [Macaca mulatta]